MALQGGAASYDVNRDGTLAPVSGTVRNGRSGTCWIVLTDNQRYAYTTKRDEQMTSPAIGPIRVAN